MVGHIGAKSAAIEARIAQIYRTFGGKSRLRARKSTMEEASAVEAPHSDGGIPSVSEIDIFRDFHSTMRRILL